MCCVLCMCFFFVFFFFFQAEDGIRDLVRSRGLGDVYKRQMPLRHVLSDTLRHRRRNLSVWMMHKMRWLIWKCAWNDLRDSFIRCPIPAARLQRPVTSRKRRTDYWTDPFPKSCFLPRVSARTVNSFILLNWRCVMRASKNAISCRSPASSRPAAELFPEPKGSKGSSRVRSRSAWWAAAVQMSPKGFLPPRWAVLCRRIQAPTGTYTSIPVFVSPIYRPINMHQT